MAKSKEKGKGELVSREKTGTLSPFDEMDRFFGDFYRHPFSLLKHPLWPQPDLSAFEEISPVVDIFEDGEEVVFKAEVPGLRKKDLSVDISDNRLTISGEKKKEKKIKKEDYFRQERTYGSFCRNFILPENVDAAGAKASFQDGVLEIRLPKTEKTKKKKIEIN